MSQVLEKLKEAARVRWETDEAAGRGAGAPSTAATTNDTVRLIPIASGKGGVGKTNIAVGIAVSAGLRFAKTDQRVLLIDGDLGLPNTDLVLGIRPRNDLSNVVERAVNDVSELITQTRYPALDFIAGAEEATLLLSNLYYQQRRSLMGKISKLNSSLIIFDLGASASKEILDFFGMSSSGIVVLNPEPSSLRDGYIFIKNALIRRMRHELLYDAERRHEFDSFIEAAKGNWATMLAMMLESGSPELRTIRENTLDTFRPMIILNRVENFTEGLDTARTFIRTAEAHLGIKIRYLGSVMRDEAVTRAVKARCPFRIGEPDSQASRCIDEITQRILNGNDVDLDRNFATFGRMITSRLLGRQL